MVEELDGKKNTTEDYNNDFKQAYSELNNTKEKLIKMKTIIYEKNNKFKLTDGRTIQEALVENTILRKIKGYYESLLENSSQRVSIFRYSLSIY